MSFERRSVRVGRVVSDSMDKTVVVSVEWKRPHRLYKKPVRKRSRMMAHDSDNSCRMGDVVQIVESRPRSKTKRWQVREILSRIEIAEIQPEDITVPEDVLKAPVTPPVVLPAAVEPQEAEAVVEDLEAVLEDVEPEGVVESEPVAGVEPEAKAEPESEEKDKS